MSSYGYVTKIMTNIQARYFFFIVFFILPGWVGFHHFLKGYCLHWSFFLLKDPSQIQIFIAIPEADGWVLGLASFKRWRITVFTDLTNILSDILQGVLGAGVPYSSGAYILRGGVNCIENFIQMGMVNEGFSEVVTCHRRLNMGVICNRIMKRG